MRITIDFEITPRAKRALLWVGTPLAVLVGSAMFANAAWTADTAWMATGQRLSSVKLKALFDETDTRLVALQAREQIFQRQLVEIVGARSVGTANFPFGPQAPTLGTGATIFDQTITPRTVGSVVALDGSVTLMTTRSGGDNYVLCVYVDNETAPVRCKIDAWSAERASTIPFHYEFTTTGLTPVRVRVQGGGSAGADVWLNTHAISSSANLGNTISSWMTVMERK